MKLSKGDAVKIEMTADNSLMIYPVPQSSQGSKGTRVPKTTTVKGDVSV